MRKVETLASGRFQVRFRYAGKQTSESFDTHREAADFATWLDVLGEQGALDRLYEEAQKRAVPTLDDVARDHIEHIEGAGPGHKVKQQRLWDRTWAPRIGHLRSDLVARDHLIKALEDLARNGRAPGRGYSEKSLKNQRGLLHGVLERVVDKGYLTKHPGLKLKLPQVVYALHMDDDEDDASEMVCLDQLDFEVLYAAMVPHYRALLRFLVGTGCRWGEVVVLRRKDLNLRSAQPTVTIRRALKWSPDGNFTIGPPKTKRSKRTITLPAQVVEDLRPLVAGKAENDLVFTAPRGGMIRHRTFWSDNWRPASWRAQHCPEHTDPACRCGTAHPKRCKVHEKPPAPCGCPDTLSASPRIHDMRHTHASWLLARGVPVHVVSARLGHESIQTTVGTYGHLLPDAQIAAAAAAEQAFTLPAVRPELTD
ncbi:MAG TPA: site-specific integrase [Aeromicrobium sp.]|nr:site-specific integrase [Aeromicrobium sp.]HKY58330.1 site-specific integrase [Aeromicrobium sp.]